MSKESGFVTCDQCNGAGFLTNGNIIEFFSKCFRK